eukprot:s6279_g9.t1
MSPVRMLTTGDPPQRELTAVEIIQVGLMWRVARQAFGIQDVDPLAPPSVGDGAASIPAASASQGRKKIKANAVIDQMDESEIDVLNQSELDEAYQNHVALTGWDPPAEAEPTPKQIAALKTKVVIRGEAPYADFSVLTPYGRRMQKQMKARSWILQSDGSFKALDVPWPPTFDVWKACFRVYKAALFMLRHPSKPASATSPAVPAKLVVTPAALEEYFELVSKLNDEFPETWHLLLQAEDRCRAEMFERFRRELTRAAAEGKMPMGLTFDGEAPWSGVFQYAARNERFWNEHVVRPAQNFIARGGRSMSMEKAQASTVSDQAQQAENVSAALAKTPGVPSPPGQGTSKFAEKRRRKRQEAERAQEELAKKQRVQPNAGKLHPKKSGDMYITTAEGIEICFLFSKGRLGACPEPCKNCRAHVCQFCLGAHANLQCNHASSKTAGKGGGKTTAK